MKITEIEKSVLLEALSDYIQKYTTIFESPRHPQWAQMIENNQQYIMGLAHELLQEITLEKPVPRASKNKDL